MLRDEGIDINKLKGLIVSKGMTQKEMAEKLGIAENTMYRKMKKGVFNSDEMNKMVKILKIDNPGEIFFNQSVN